MSTRTGEIVRTREILRTPISPSIQQQRAGVYSIPHTRRLQDKVVLLLGIDDDIGCAAARAFAREGASIVMTCRSNGADVARTRWQVEQAGSLCVGLTGDQSDPRFCTEAISACLSTFGRLDIVVNNYTLRYSAEELASMADEQLGGDLQKAIEVFYYLTEAALRHVTDASNIIHTLSVIEQSATPRNGTKREQRTKQKLAQTFTHLFQSRDRVTNGMSALNMTDVKGTTLNSQDRVLLSYMLFVSSDGSLMGGKMLRAGSE